MKKPVLLALFFAALVAVAGASTWTSEEYYYTVTLPSGWTVSDDNDPTQIVFSNDDEDAAVVIGVFESDPTLSSEELLQAVVDKMRMKGTKKVITFKGHNAVSGSYQFTMNGSRLAGDIVIFSTQGFYFMMMGSSLKETYSTNRPQFKSLIESFDLDGKALDAAYNGGTEVEIAPVTQTKTNTTKTTTTTTKNTTPQSTDKSKEYALSVDWGDLASAFTFDKTDYETAVKEGKAIVASGDLWTYYKVDTENDPHYTETFWGRFFQDMYDKNYMRVQNMVEFFKAQAKAKNWTSWDLAMEVIKCVQTIPYERPYQVVTDQTQAASVLDFFTPNEIAWYDKGDCDTKSMLMIMILRQLGYDMVLYFSESYEHAMAGININAKGTYKTDNGTKYYFIEATYPGWNIGDLPKEFGDPAKWTLVTIK